MEMLCRSKPANLLHVASEFTKKALELVECCRGLCEAILKPFFLVPYYALLCSRVEIDVGRVNLHVSHALRATCGLLAFQTIFQRCLLASSVLSLARLFVGRFCVSWSAKDMFGEPPCHRRPHISYS